MDYLENITKECIEKLDKNQSGFIPGRSCVDNLFFIHQFIEKHMSHNHEIFLAFIDSEKAYDSVSRSNLWKFMADMVINGSILEILKNTILTMFHMSKLVMNCQIQLKIQKALD